MVEPNILGKNKKKCKNLTIFKFANQFMPLKPLGKYVTYGNIACHNFFVASDENRKAEPFTLCVLLSAK